MVPFSKKLGSTLIVIGTAIGAGMLALPMTSATSGLVPSLLLIIGMWALMTYTGLLVLEVNLTLPFYKNNFNSMARSTLGRPGELIAWIICLLLLYALTAAYIAGNGSLLSELIATYFHHTVTPKTNSIIFTLIFGSVVFWSTRTVDLVNRFLISIKGLFLVAILVLLLPHVNFTEISQNHPHALLAAAPIFLTAFGYHTVIPSLTNYIGKEAKTLKWIIIVGTTIPLAIYIIWLICALSIIPMTGNQSFESLIQNGSPVGQFVGILTLLVQNKVVTLAVNGFANIAMTTSFLGVSLGLFDFLADAFKRANHRFGRMQTAFLTFIPPFLFALLYPKGFIMALGYAGLCVAILEVILPALMVYRLRKQGGATLYKVWGGTPLLLLVFIIGILLISL